MTLRKRRILETSRGSVRSHSMYSSLWRSLRKSHATDCNMV